jgi:hypothetical protein
VLCLESRKLLLSGRGIRLFKVDEHEMASECEPMRRGACAAINTAASMLEFD